MKLATLAAALLALPLASCAETRAIPGPVMAQHGSQGTMFVANKRGASLSRIDIANGAETHRVDTCENPHELTVSPDGAQVLVACYSGSGLELFRATDLRRLGAVELGENARVHSAVWLTDGNIVAGAEGRGTLFRASNVIMRDVQSPIMGLREIGEAGNGPGPHLLAVDDARKIAWGTVIPTGEVVRYDLAAGRETARRRIGEQIEAIALSPDGTDLWVASNSQNSASRLDPDTLEFQQGVGTGETPIRLAFHPSGDWVVTSNYGGGDLTVIDARRGEVERRIVVSNSAEAAQVTLAFNADGSRLYVAETANDTIAEIDFASGEVLRRIRTGPGGDGLAIVE